MDLARVRRGCPIPPVAFLPDFWRPGARQLQQRLCWGRRSLASSIQMRG